MNFYRKIVVDNIAWDDSASTSIEMVTDFPLDIAINHNPKIKKYSNKWNSSLKDNEGF